MSKQAVFTLKLEAELRDQFMAEAEASHRPASQLVREFMRDFIQHQNQARDHDAWARSEIEQGMREADDPNVGRMSHEEVIETGRRRLLARMGGEN